MHICDVLQNMINNKLYENHVAVKLIPITPCVFDTLDVYKNHRQHQSISKNNECV